MKKTLFIILVLAVLGAAGYWWVLHQASKVPEGTPTPSLYVSAYSLDGQVVSISGTKVRVTVGRVEETSTGTTFATSEKEFALAPQITVTEEGKTRQVSAASLATSLKPKDRAVFIGAASVSPWSGGTLIVHKIEILSRATSAGPLPKGAPVVR